MTRIDAGKNDGRAMIKEPAGLILRTVLRP
jgi:hypothetical protein